MKKIALINDLSGFGKCSLTAAIPVISIMGIQACPLPTAVLSAQTGFEDYYCDDYTDRMNCFTDHWKKLGISFDGIYSGYLAGAEQIDKVLYFLEKFKEKHTLYLADPVMGDHGKTYKMFTEKLLAGMKQLTKQADVITPNLTELCLLADVAYEEVVLACQTEDYIKKIQDIAQELLKKATRQQSIIVTGILRQKDGLEYVGNLAVSRKETVFIETPYTGRGFSGTGDLFASVVCGSIVKGLTIHQAMEKATSFLHTAIEDASKQNIPSNHGVNFENYLASLI